MPNLQNSARNISPESSGKTQDSELTAERNSGHECGKRDFEGAEVLGPDSDAAEPSKGTQVLPEECSAGVDIGVQELAAQTSSGERTGVSGGAGFAHESSTAESANGGSKPPVRNRPGYDANGFPRVIPRWKRILDLLLIVLSSPVWLPIMVFLVFLVKLVSPGPVFFKQERVGFRGRKFMLLKFRSMHMHSETRCHERYLEQLMQSDTPMTKLDLRGDARLIPFGRFIRASGLDELPQLFNVLRGEMSLVGPRPCTSHEFAMYEPWQKMRVQAMPGLTGFWQVNGKNKTTFSEMIRMDIYYARNLSLRLDAAIIFRTLPALLGQVRESRATQRQAAAEVRTMNSTV